MTTKELKLAAFLLDRAADEFGNHGCNDVDQETIDAAGFTPEEEEAFCAEMRKWNGPDGDWPQSLERAHDYAIMSFLASKIIAAGSK